MALGKRELNRQRRTAEIMEAAVEQFLEKGIQNATIDDITTAAKTAKGSFYRYFDDKTDLVRQALAPFREELIGALSTCRAGLREATDIPSMMVVYEELGGELAHTLLSHSELVLLYLQESRAPAVGARAPVAAIQSEVTEIAVELTHLAHQSGVLRPFPERVSALAVVGAIERITYGVLTEGLADKLEEEQVDPLQLGAHLASLIFDGLAA